MHVFPIYKDKVPVCMYVRMNVYLNGRGSVSVRMYVCMYEVLIVIVNVCKYIYVCMCVCIIANNTVARQQSTFVQLRALCAYMQLLFLQVDQRVVRVLALDFELLVLICEALHIRGQLRVDALQVAELAFQSVDDSVFFLPTCHQQLTPLHTYIHTYTKIF